MSHAITLYDRNGNERQLAVIDAQELTRQLETNKVFSPHIFIPGKIPAVYSSIVTIKVLPGCRVKDSGNVTIRFNDGSCILMFFTGIPLEEKRVWECVARMTTDANGNDLEGLDKSYCHGDTIDVTGAAVTWLHDHHYSTVRLGRIVNGY
jgi:hypothetical protein